MAGGMQSLIAGGSCPSRQNGRLFNWVLMMADVLEGNFYPQQEGRKRSGGAAEQEGLAEAKYTEKLMNDKELTSFRKLTNWSTVK